MAGFVPNEGEALIAALVMTRTLTDRDADLELGLFTNAAAGETTTHAGLTEPSGTGYARISLADATWTGSTDSRAYTAQTFTAGAGGWTGTVYGYFVNTKAAGGAKKIVFMEIDGAGPYTFAANDSYAVTLNITFA